MSETLKKKANLSLPHCEGFYKKKNTVKSHIAQLQCSRYATSQHKPVEPRKEKFIKKLDLGETENIPEL